MKETKQDSLVYISPVNSSFIKEDIKILKDKYQVYFFVNRWNEKYRIPFLLLWQIIFLPLYIIRSKAIIISFGGYWSLIPVIFGSIFSKSVYIIVHGADACNFEEINYGNLRKFPLRWFTKISFRYASKLLPVSKSLIYTINTYYDIDNPKKLGIKAEFDQFNPDFEVIPNGFDLSFWKQDKNVFRESNGFVTVASHTQLERKGIDMIYRVAEYFPEIKIYIVGCEKPKNWATKKNVMFVGKLNPEDLRDYYNKVKYYLQLSVFEGFGCSLCEAMLCGCIPIGSNVNVIPEIIGDTGYVLNKRSDQDLIELLTQIIGCNNNYLSELARNRICSKFPQSTRKKKLDDLLKE